MITGGGQGIGKAVALRLLRDGYAVALLEVDEEAGRETLAELEALGEVVLSVGDVADPAAVASAVGLALERFGQLDALVNNAATAAFKSFEALTLPEWERVLAVNLTGPFLCAQAAAPHLRATRGAIVNIASTRALMSEPGGEAYGASKGGLLALTHALANSLGPEVRVNAVCPGWIDVSDWRKKAERTQADLRPEDHSQHPAGRVGRPEDIASAVAWLLSRENSFVTGTNLVIDGGMTRKMVYL